MYNGFQRLKSHFANMYALFEAVYSKIILKVNNLD
jgi:hypothetical protein